MCCIHNVNEVCESKVSLLISLGRQINEQNHKTMSGRRPFVFEIVPVNNAKGNCYKILALVRTGSNGGIVLAYIAVNHDGAVLWDWKKDIYKKDYQELVNSTVSSELDIRYSLVQF